MQRSRILFASVAAAMVLVASCSSSSDDQATDAATASDEAAAAFTVEPADDGGDEGGNSTGGGGSADGRGSEGRVTDVADVDLIAAQTERRLVYTGRVTAEVDDVTSAVGQAREVAVLEGGYVFAQEQTEGTARLTLKVPSIRFDEAFDAVVGIGDVQSQHVEADDVTDQYVDLESRQATLRSSIERLRGFLERAANVDEISRLEAELTRREAEHDVIAGQLRLLSERTTYGTITVDYHLAEAQEALLTGEDGESGPPGFAAGLATGWDAVLVIVGTAATVAGFALPFAPMAVLLLAAAWWWRRHHHSGQPSPA